jgi:hypothetical protein
MKNSTPSEDFPRLTMRQRPGETGGFSLAWKPYGATYDLETEEEALALVDLLRTKAPETGLVGVSENKMEKTWTVRQFFQCLERVP